MTNQHARVRTARGLQPLWRISGHSSTVISMNEQDDFARLASGYNGNEVLAATPAALEHFQALDAATRRMVLQLLNNTNDPDRWQRLDNHPDSKELWKWMVTLPRLNLPQRSDEDDVDRDRPGQR
jgi:hypothetical protein